MLISVCCFNNAVQLGQCTLLELSCLVLKAGKSHTEALAGPVSLRAVSAPKMALRCYLLQKESVLCSHTAKQKKEDCLHSWALL